MERYRSDASGFGQFGTAGLWRHGDWYETKISQTGKPTFATTKWMYDTTGEHFDPVTQAEKDHSLYFETFEMDRVLAFRGESDSDSNGTSFKLLDWVPSEMRLLFQNHLDKDVPLSYEAPPWLEHIDLWDRLSPVTDLLARTNPNVPETDIPSFLFESIRDAPSLIYNTGQTLLGRLGSSNLNWHFGWKPLLADLKNLITTMEISQKKLRQLQNGANRGALKITASVEAHEATETSSYEMKISDFGGPFDQAFPEFVDPYVEVTKHTKVERWGKVRYALRDDWIAAWKRLPNDEKLWKATRVAFGLHAQNPAALWEVLPWSWFIDWFAPFQELLATYNNFVPVQVVNLNLMTQETTTFSFGAIDIPWLEFNAPTTLVRTTKSRDVMSPDGELPNLHKVGVQLLGIRQLGILGSIAAVRRRYDNGSVFKSLPR